MHYFLHTQKETFRLFFRSQFIEKREVLYDLRKFSFGAFC